MRPEDVPEHLVEIAYNTFFAAWAEGATPQVCFSCALAAVLSLAVAEERAECEGVLEGLLDHADGGEIYVIRRAIDAIRSRGEPR